MVRNCSTGIGDIYLGTDQSPLLLTSRNVVAVVYVDKRQ